MSLPREQATAAADLPHPFPQGSVRPFCGVCKGQEFDVRHLAWEKAALELGSNPASLPRETGV